MVRTYTVFLMQASNIMYHLQLVKGPLKHADEHTTIFTSVVRRSCVILNVSSACSKQWFRTTNVVKEEYRTATDMHQVRAIALAIPFPRASRL